MGLEEELDLGVFERGRAPRMVVGLLDEALCAAEGYPRAYCTI